MARVSTAVVSAAFLILLSIQVEPTESFCIEAAFRSLSLSSRLRCKAPPSFCTMRMAAASSSSVISGSSDTIPRVVGLQNDNSNENDDKFIVVPALTVNPRARLMDETHHSDATTIRRRHRQQQQQEQRSVNPWMSLVPPPLSRGGLDVRVAWTDPCQGALDMIECCQFTNAELAHQAQRELQVSLELFATFCQDHVASILGCDHHQHHHDDGDDNVRSTTTNPPLTFRARIVATRGSAGTKCPKWHVDHVPVRWIQALVGKGCDYIKGETGIDRSSLIRPSTDEEDDDDEDDDDDHRNTMEHARPLVNPSMANIQQAKEGQAMVLLGTKWRCKHDYDHQHLRGTTSSFVSLPNPAIHKSPTLWPGEPRVLLTLDIIIP